jgi:hypothetical protein
MQSARPELADFTPPKSLQNGKRVDHKPPVSMSVHAGRPASTGSDLKPTANPDSPINSARFCRKEGAPEMMQPKQKTPAEIAADKNSDVLSVLQKAKKALTPTEIAHAIQASRSGECWCMRKYPGQKPVADTSLIGAVLRRIKAVKVERGLWLKPGAKVKVGAK